MTGNPPKINIVSKSNYRSLLGEQAWNRLHTAIQKRFTEAACHKPVTYVGIMEEVSLSFAGKLLAQLCRLIGTPLALHAGKHIPTRVCVYPNKELQGVTWDRYYYFPYKRTNRVKSTKCIRSDLGLVEVVGCGFGMQLTLREQEGALLFESSRFFLQLGKFRVSIPDLLTPGTTTVMQKALDSERFQFSLDVVHPLLGRVFYQLGTFQQEPESVD